jgi:DNA adenine methylase
LRWAGGKRQLVTKLVEFLPKNYKKSRYHEPFLGAGSLFFWLAPPDAFLSDANEHLIETYRAIRDDWKVIARHLTRHAKLTCQRYYYEIRDQYNSSRFSAAQAARFIYLNKTCFNGIFRVNVKGQFNVPYGWKEPPSLPSLNDLKIASEYLQKTRLMARSFEAALSDVKKGDFVYLDPPYPPLNGTSYFTHYTADRFSQLDQEKLANAVKILNEQGCQILLTSASTPLIRKLYRSFNVTPLPVTRFITCKAVRHKVTELVITNY